MKPLIYLTLLAVWLFGGCSKSPDTTPNSNTGSTTSGPTTVANTTTYNNGYVVKTLGISRIVVAVDANYKLKTAVLYGGGNKVLLKAGTGNSLEVGGQAGYYTIPDAFGTPDGTLPNFDTPIDNGAMLDTASYTTVVKIKGFDKSKTGYNQLNLVMCKYVYALDTNSGLELAGQKTNLTYLGFTVEKGKKPSDYAGDFFKKLFSGSINVSAVDIALPKAQNPYIVEDEIIDYGTTSYAATDKSVPVVNLDGPYYRVLFSKPNTTINISSTTLHFQWVNANNTTVQTDVDGAVVKFSNIKTGGIDQIVEPSDTTSKVFLRISGFDPAKTGFNQLRLFLANDGLEDGSINTIVYGLPFPNIDANFVKNTFYPSNLNCGKISPQWYHF